MASNIPTTKNSLYTVLTGQNGLNEAYQVKNLTDIQSDPLFNLVTNFDPKFRSGINVNKNFVNEYINKYQPTTVSSSKINFEFYTTAWTSKSHFYLTLPVLFTFKENVDMPIAENASPFNTVKWQYNEYIFPIKCMSQLFRRVSLKMGNYVEMLTSFEQISAGISFVMNQSVTSIRGADKFSNLMLGPAKTVYREFAHTNAEYKYDSEGRAETTTFNFKTLMGYLFRVDGNEAIRYVYTVNPVTGDKTNQTNDTGGNFGAIPLVKFCIPFRDMFMFFKDSACLPPGLKIVLELEVPLTNTANFGLVANKIYTPVDGATPSIMGAIWADTKQPGIGNWSLIGAPRLPIINQLASFQSTSRIQTGLPSQFPVGLIASVAWDQVCYVDVIGWQLYPSIEADLRNNWTERPLVYNCEKIEEYPIDWTRSQTSLNVILRTNTNIAQQYFLAFISNIDQNLSFSAAKTDIAAFLPKFNLTGVPDNFAGPYYFPAWAKIPLPTFIKRMDINIGSYPLKLFDFRPTPWMRYPDQENNNFSECMFINECAEMDHENMKADVSYQEGYAPTHQQYYTHMAPANITPYTGSVSDYITFSMKPGQVDRGLIDSELGAFQVQINLFLDDSHPLWFTFLGSNDNTCKLQCLRKTQMQVSIDKATNVQLVSWPAMLIQGGAETVIQNPPPPTA